MKTVKTPFFLKGAFVWKGGAGLDSAQLSAQKREDVL